MLTLGLNVVVVLCMFFVAAWDTAIVRVPLQAIFRLFKKDAPSEPKTRSDPAGDAVGVRGHLQVETELEIIGTDMGSKEGLSSVARSV